MTSRVPSAADGRVPFPQPPSNSPDGHRRLALAYARRISRSTPRNIPPPGANAAPHGRAPREARGPTALPIAGTHRSDIIVEQAARSRQAVQGDPRPRVVGAPGARHHGGSHESRIYGRRRAAAPRTSNPVTATRGLRDHQAAGMRGHAWKTWATQIRRGFICLERRQTVRPGASGPRSRARTDAPADWWPRAT